MNLDLLGDAVLHGGDRATLRLAREFPHSVAAVWTALTERSLTRLWWADLRADLRLGGEFSLEWLTGPPGELEWWPGEITAFDPPRLLEHTNSEHGLLRWELEPLDVGALRARTRLRLTNDLEGEDEWVPMSLAAWHLHLEQLEVALDGGSVDWGAWGTAKNGRLRELRAAYAATLSR
ncbi:SRPBCC family protein [Kineococcus sp. SYSU DK003]|uniref:SRPBCC family protein n=1 Tax=Kineococcus sp. SYSU DK003 TaxID=3383124 RepID=UPI003D7DC0B7